MFKTSSVVFEILTSLVSPAVSLKDTIQEYQRKREEKERLKEDLANSLEAETKEFQKIASEINDLGEKLLPILQEIDGQPSPRQVIEVIDCLSPTPRILAKLVTSFIHLARACKDISKQEGLMKSLLDTNNRFMYDFIQRMGNTYVGKNTVKIDSTFLRFIFTYKREIIKGSKIGKKGERQMEFIEKRMESVLHSFNQVFLKRHMRMIPIKKWKSNMSYFSRVVKDMEVDTEGMDTSGLMDFMSSESKQLARFLDKSP